MNEPDPTSPQQSNDTGGRAALSGDDIPRTPSADSPSNISSDDRTVISTKAPMPRQIGTHGLPPSEVGRLLEGERLGHYQLEKFVGGGGMGAVFRARDTMLDRTVAVKVLSSSRTSGEEMQRRFRNEAQSAARLDHENIARVYYVGEDRGFHYIIFEYIEGINVRDLVERDGPLRLADAVDYTLQVAEALAHAALRDVVHRDIKPSNILITPDNRAKLVDMGLARLHQVGRSDEDLTASGVTLGTFDYISPEQARDPRSADVRSDLYSLGCTLYFMLSGQPPFSEGTMLQKLLQHQGDSVPNILDLRPDLPEEISPVLHKLLAKSPARRYQTPDALIADLLILSSQLGLESASSRGTVLVTPGVPVDSVLRRTLPWFVPVAILLLIVFALSGSHRRTESSPGLPAFSSAVKSANNTAHRATRSDQGEDQMSAAASSASENRAPLISKAAGPDSSAHANNGPFVEASGNRTNLADGEPDMPTDINETNDPTKRDDGLVADSSLYATDRAHRLELPKSTVPYRGDQPQSASPEADGPLDPVEALVVGDGDAEGGYATIHAAVAVAKSGDVIELQFARRVVDRPIEVHNKRLTIRAGDGLSPRIVFHIDSGRSDPAQNGTSLLIVSEGQLRLVNVDLEMDIPESPSFGTAGLSLVASRGAESVKLENCRLTIRNAAPGGGVRHANVSFLTLGRPPQPESRLFGEPATNRPTEVRLENCIARGDATLLSSEAGQTFRLVWENGLLVTSQRMFVVRGGTDHVESIDSWNMLDSPSARTEKKIEIDLQQLTAVAGSGLLLVTDSMTRSSWIPIMLRCHDSIVKIDADATMIEHQSSESRGVPQSFVYNGDRNYYESVTTFWRFGRPSLASEQMDFDAWQKHWTARDSQGEGSEINPHRNAVPWRQLPDKRLPSDSHMVTDYAFDRINVPENPALRGASDGREVGFQPDQTLTVDLQELRERRFVD